MKFAGRSFRHGLNAYGNPEFISAAMVIWLVRRFAGTSSGGVVLSGKRETPRRKAVASGSVKRALTLAASVRLHGTRPWHLERVRALCGSGKRETPRRKAVASGKSASALW